MDRLKKTLIGAEKQKTKEPGERIEVVGLSVASCLKQAAAHWGTNVMALDYEILEEGKQSLLNTKPYRIQVYLLPEEERFAGLEELSLKLGLGQRLLDKDLDAYIAPQNKNGRAVVRNYFNGVFLSVFPPVGEGLPASKEDAMKKVRQAGAQDYNLKLIEETLRKSTGKAVKIADFVHQVENDSTCRVEIIPNQMKALVYISPPRPGGRHLRVQDVVAALKAHGIVLGFKEKHLEAALLEDRYGEAIVAAEGKPPQHGDDAKINYKVNVKKNILHLHEDFTGRVDFKNLNMIENVVVGQVLAEKIPAKKGKVGYTIFNQIVKAKHGRDCHFKQSKGTILSDDSAKLIAETNGQVVFSRGRIAVEPIYRVLSNVGPKTGNISFLGSVVVGGAVLSGFEVKASGHVEIHGGLQKAVVEAEGDIVVRSGIQGGRVESTGGSVIAKYIQDAEVSALEDVNIQEGVLRSQVEAGAAIICNGRRAKIVGGRLRAARELRARSIGSPSYTSTEITVGTDPVILSKYDEVKKIMKEVMDKISQVEKTITTLRMRKRLSTRSFTREQEENLDKSVESSAKLKSRQAELKTELAKLEETFQGQESEGKVHAEKQIFPGVIVNILRARQNISDTYGPITLSYEHGHIKIGKLKKSKESLHSHHKRWSR